MEHSTGQPCPGHTMFGLNSNNEGGEASTGQAVA